MGRTGHACGQLAETVKLLSQTSIRAFHWKLAPCFNLFENFEEDGLYFGVLPEEEVPILGVLDEAEKLYKQFLLKECEVLPPELIEDKFEFHHIGGAVRRANHHHVEVGEDVGGGVVADPAVLIVVVVEDVPEVLAQLPAQVAFVLRCVFGEETIVALLDGFDLVVEYVLFYLLGKIVF